MKPIIKTLAFQLLAMTFFIASLNCPSAFALPPEIHSVEPDHGLINSTTSITIHGDNYETKPKVALYGGGPYIVGSVVTPGDENDTYDSGNYAYVTDGDLQVIDISNHRRSYLFRTCWWVLC